MAITTTRTTEVPGYSVLQPFSVEHLLPRPDRYLEPVLLGGNRAREILVVRAIRVIRYVEVHQELPLPLRLGFQVAPGAIGFAAGQCVGKGQKVAIVAGVN